MRILGREISVKRLISYGLKNPAANLIHSFNYLRQKKFLDGSFSGGYALPPSTIVVETTYECNLRCKTCWFYGKSGIFKDKKISGGLSFEQLKKVVDNVAWFKPYLYFTGGEPLINKSTLPIIKYAKKKGLIVGIVTNGTLLTKENSKKLISSNLDFITVSIDGPKETHDKIREIKCFEKAIQGINNVIEARKMRKKKFPLLTLNCTLSDYNHFYLEKVVSIGEKCDADVIAFQHPCFLLKRTIDAHHKVFKKLFDKSDDLIEGFENESASKIDIEKLYKTINKIKMKKKKWDLRLYPDLSLNQMKSYYEKERAINDKCINPWFSATIKPNGDVSPCLGHVVGNINKEKFMKIWNGKRFKNFRKILKQKKFFPGCIRCCAFFLNFEKK
jgi:radical SAM protein with 4Fe4S-binding SPASM domain